MLRFKTKSNFTFFDITCPLRSTRNFYFLPVIKNDTRQCSNQLKNSTGAKMSIKIQLLALEFVSTCLLRIKKI